MVCHAHRHFLVGAWGANGPRPDTLAAAGDLFTDIAVGEPCV